MSDIGNVSLGVTFTDTVKEARKLAQDVDKELKRALTEGFDTPKLPEAASKDVLKQLEATKKAKQKEAEESKKLREKELEDYEKTEVLKRKQIAQTFDAAEKARVKAATEVEKAAQREIAAYLKAEQAKEKAAIKAAQVQEREARRISEVAQRELNRTQQLYQRYFAGISKAHERSVAERRRAEEKFIADFTKRTGARFEGGVLFGPGQITLGQKFKGIVDSAERSLSRFGLTTRDVSVILGAGLAGGVAFAIREIIQFIFEVTKLTQQLEALKIVNEETFGVGSEQITRFAENAVQQLGLSQNEVFRFANRFGVFFRNLGFGESIIDDLSTSLITLGKVLSRSTGDVLTTQQAIDALFGVLRAEFDQLEQFGIKISEDALKAFAFKNRIIESNRALTEQEKAIAGVLLVLERSGTQIDIFNRLQKEVPDNVSTFKAAIEELKLEFGKGFGPAIANAIGLVADFIGLITDAILKLGDFIDKVIEAGDTLESKLKNGIDAALEALDRGAQKIGIDLGIDFDEEDKRRFQDEVKKLTDDALAAEVKELQLLEAVTGGNEESTNKLAIAQKELKDRGLELDNATGNLVTTEKVLGDQSVQTALAQGRLEQAMLKAKQAAEEQADAQLRLNRAIEDAELRINEAEIALARTEEDVNRTVFRARRDRVRAYRESAEAIEDAEEKVSDAVERGRREIRDAQQRLADARRKDRREARNSLEELKDTEKERAKTILEAQLDIEAAQRKGDLEAENKARRDLVEAQRDKDLERQKRDVSEAAKDREREIARLEVELSETRIDAKDAIADAQEALAETVIEQADRITDAEDRVNDAIRDGARQSEDALRRLEDAQRDSSRAVTDALTNLDRVTEKYKTLGEVVGNTAENIKVLNDQFNKLNSTLNLPDDTLQKILRLIGFPLGPLIELGEGRAHGGSTRPGRPYLVGEDGMELIIPGRAQVVSNDQLMNVLQEMLSGSGRGANVNQNIQVYQVANDPEATAFAVAARLAQGLH